MTDTTTPDEPDLKSAEYVLRLMAPEEESAFEADLARDAGLQARVLGWVQHFAQLNGSFAERTPRAAVKKMLMSRLFGESAPRRAWWQTLWLWQGVSLAALALAAFLGVQSLMGPAPGAGYVSHLAGEAGGPQILAVYEPSDGSLHLTRVEGAARPGRVLELWAIQGDQPPQSLGVLPDTAQARIALPAHLHAPEGLTLAISDEPVGGSTTGAPTGDVLALGAAHAL
jgi:anti-sigma-K factor RskA